VCSAFTSARPASSGKECLVLDFYPDMVLLIGGILVVVLIVVFFVVRSKRPED
jgi:hypothetical protein